MADWAQLGGLLGGGAAFGALIQGALNRFYTKGRADMAAKNADISAASSIMRLEMTVNKLNDTVSAHVKEDASYFGSMAAGLDALKEANKEMRETMRDAAAAMSALTETLARAVVRRE